MREVVRLGWIPMVCVGLVQLFCPLCTPFVRENYEESRSKDLKPLTLKTCLGDMG